jgi:hypothetical protein
VELEVEPELAAEHFVEAAVIGALAELDEVAEPEDPPELPPEVELVGGARPR